MIIRGSDFIKLNRNWKVGVEEMESFVGMYPEKVSVAKSGIGFLWCG